MLCVLCLLSFAPAHVFAEDHIYENVFYQVNNDSHSRVSEQDIRISCSDQVYFFLFIDKNGGGSYYVFSRTPMTWVSDYSSDQSPKYWSPSGYSGSYSEGKICVIHLGPYNPRGESPLNPLQKYTWYLNSQITISGETNSLFSRVYDFLNTGNSDGFDFSNWEGTYDKSLGALKGVSLYYLSVEHSDGDSTGNYFTFYDRILYSSKSTTGFSLKQDGVKVRVFLSLTYLKKKDNSVYKQGPLVLVGEYNAIPLQFDVNISDAEAVLLGQTPPSFIMNGWEKMAAGVVRSDTMYLQIVSSDGKYGDYLRIRNLDKDGNRPQDVVDSDDQLVSPDDGGYSKPDSDGGFGNVVDGDPDDAYDHVQDFPSDAGFDIGDISSAISSVASFVSSLSSMIVGIPSVIGKFFSFLPSWCLQFVSISFVAMVLLLIIKTIRG